uniref:Uncharacterized protein n=1 Tax=Siphoviridae sp. ctBLh2 TaxID=2827803 RepID=A0A8S5S3G2_9CAUD|nr:MAG TPA: hypothetical protein [Siphoviridae sp. ctBLh2]
MTSPGAGRTVLWRITARNTKRGAPLRDTPRSALQAL